MLLKLVLAILFMGLAFRLVFFRSTRLPPVLEEIPLAKKSVLAEPPISVQIEENGAQAPREGNLIWLIFVVVFFFFSYFTFAMH